MNFFLLLLTVILSEPLEIKSKKMSCRKKWTQNNSKWVPSLIWLHPRPLHHFFENPPAHSWVTNFFEWPLSSDKFWCFISSWRYYRSSNSGNWLANKIWVIACDVDFFIFIYTELYQKKLSFRENSSKKVR